MAATLAAIGALLCMGVVNFVGPLVTRRTPVLTVVMVGQGVAAIPLIVAVIVSQMAMPGLGFVVVSAATGAITAFATVGSFRAGQIGEIGVVSVIIAMASIIPAMAGILGGERPPVTQWIGIVLAAAGTGLVLSRGLRKASEAEKVRDGMHVSAAAMPVGAAATAPARGLGYATVRRVSGNWRLLALMASVGFGIFLLVFAKLSEESLLWAGTVSRVVMAAVALGLIFALRQPLFAPGGVRRQLLPLPFLGFAMISAIMLYGYAATSMLTVASAVSSFSPVVTTGLSWAILHERLSPLQIAGLGTAVVGLVFIAV